MLVGPKAYARNVPVNYGRPSLVGASTIVTLPRDSQNDAVKRWAFWVELDAFTYSWALSGDRLPRDVRRFLRAGPNNFESS